MAVTKTFDDEIQSNLISLMISNPDVFVRVRPILDSAFFSKGPIQKAIDYILEYNREYNAIPTIEEIYVNTKLSLIKVSSDLNNNAIIAISSEIEAFCKKRKLELSILKCATLIEEDNADSIDKIIKEALLFGLQKDLGIDFFDNPGKHIKKLNSTTGLISTGWVSLDAVLDGGIYYGDLIYFIAPTGGGKSIALQNFARLQCLKGKNVIYLTHELNAELVLKRISALFTETPLRNINTNIDTVNDRIVTIGDNDLVGNLQIKWIRPGSNIHDIESYINEYETVTGKIVNVVISDYADLLSPTTKISLENIHLRDKYVSEELRTFAQERTLSNRPTIVATASQLTKDGQTDEDVNLSNISGGISKGYTADTMIACISTEIMREQNKMNFVLVKSRNSGGVGRYIPMYRDKDTLIVKDIDKVQSNEYTSNLIDKLKNEHNSNNINNINNVHSEIVMNTSNETVNKNLALLKLISK